MTGHAPSIANLQHTLLALVVVIAFARALGAVFRKVHQPPVLGEIIAGIALGPSLLGRVAPGTFNFLLPSQVAPNLSLLAQVGIILYMFLVGLELDTELMLRQGRTTFVVSHASIVVPFALGVLVAFGLYPTFAGPSASFVVFALFLGVSMSVTAFPVLARILSDRGIQSSPLGVMSLACAAAGDVTAWCLLAILVSVGQARMGSGAVTVLLTGAYLVLMVVVVRPLVQAWVVRYGMDRIPRQTALSVLCIGMLLSALCTEVIGIHAIFGAFLLGAIIPHESALARDITRRLEDLVVVLLLPAYFAFTGLRTEIGLLGGTEQWLLCGLLIVVASVGKLGGAAGAARLSGMSWRDSISLGTLMNTRGLMELVVLNVGFDMGVIPPSLFAMLVVMAIVTTMMTGPMLQVVTRGDASLASVAEVSEPEPAARG